MEKINLETLSITELYKLQKACTLLYEKKNGEYIGMKSTVNPRNYELYDGIFEEMEKKMKKYMVVRDKVLSELERRIESIEDEEEN